MTFQSAIIIVRTCLIKRNVLGMTDIGNEKQILTHLSSHSH